VRDVSALVRVHTLIL